MDLRETEEPDRVQPGTQLAISHCRANLDFDFPSATMFNDPGITGWYGVLATRKCSDLSSGDDSRSIKTAQTNWRTVAALTAKRGGRIEVRVRSGLIGFPSRLIENSRGKKAIRSNRVVYCIQAPLQANFKYRSRTPMYRFRYHERIWLIWFLRPSRTPMAVIARNV